MVVSQSAKLHRGRGSDHDDAVSVAQQGLHEAFADSEEQRMRRTLYTYEYVELPYDDVTQLLAEDAAGVLQAATQSAADHAEEVVALLTVEVGGFEVGHHIRIDVGKFEPVEIMHVEVPLRWAAREREALFPSMEATLDVRMVPMAMDRTQIALSGSYEVPLGPVGAALDDVVGHHVAEAAVHRFVQDLVKRLELAAAQ